MLRATCHVAPDTILSTRKGSEPERHTYEELKGLAAELHTTVGNAVTLAVRALRQDVVGGELATPLRNDEVTWLDAELG